MIAGFLCAALLAELAVYAAAGGWLWLAHGVSPWASALLALLVFFGLRVLVIGRLAEARALLVVYTWGQLLQPWLAPRDPARIEPGILPVLFVHGIYCNAGVWCRLLRELKQRGSGNLFTMNLEPPLAGIDHFARQLGERVEEICRAATVDKVIVVAHSMGGLVARAWVARLGGAARTARLVTIASPHHGSLIARRAPGRCAGELAPDGPWLERLRADEARAAKVATLSVFSRGDELVLPQESSRLEEARNVELERRGHLELLLAPEVLRLLAGEIAAARGGSPS